VRNEDYWDLGKPYLDQVVYRILPDAGARTAALEAGDVQLVGNSGVGAADLKRLADLPTFTVTTKGYEYIGLNTYFMFNLDRPAFQDVRVRRAIAHAINRQLLVDDIWFGYASQPTGAFSPTIRPFFDADAPRYDFDPARAAALLDEAGLPKGPRRLAITHDYAPLGEQYALTADYLRAALGRIGIAVEVRNQDLASYVRRIYSTRDFDTANYLLSTGPDPAIGIQRIYSSAGFMPGVPCSRKRRAPPSRPSAGSCTSPSSGSSPPSCRRSRWSRLRRRPSPAVTCTTTRSTRPGSRATSPMPGWRPERAA
jgi:peptide/nickel transport system substrate-binding protein